MPKVKNVTQPNIKSTQLPGSSGPGPAQNTRESKLRDHLSSVGSSSDLKIDIREPPNPMRSKIGVGRKDPRVANLADTLDDKGVLTTKERQWLATLGDDHPEAFRKLENLLHVPKYWRPGQRGVWSKQDRMNIRLQTLKAAVHEALKTADTDATNEDKKKTVARALGEAEQLRWALNRQAPLQDVRMYKLVTTETLRNPNLLYKPYNRNLANKWLADALRHPRDISPDIGRKSSVAGAVKPLIDNDLLNKNAALRLLRTLRTEPKIINKLMSLDSKTVPRRADRRKIRSMLLLRLAYSPTSDLAYLKGALLSESDEPGKRWYELFAELPAPGLHNDLINDEWLGWAQAPAPAANDQEALAEQRKSKRKAACATLAEKLPDLLEQSSLFTHNDPDHSWTRDHSDYILAEKKDVSKALLPLLKNNLLTPDAARGLEKRLTDPEVWEGGLIAFIESATNNPSVAQADRDKVRSLLYLGFAFATKENYKLFQEQARKEFWVGDQAPKPAYKSLPDLPRSGGPEDESCKAWLSFWKTIPNPVENDLKDDHSLLQEIDNNNNKYDAKEEEAAIHNAEPNDPPVKATRDQEKDPSVAANVSDDGGTDNDTKIDEELVRKIQKGYGV